MVTVQWVARVVDETGARDVVHTGATPAVITDVTLDQANGVWLVELRGDPNAAIDIDINGDIVSVTLDSSGTGSIALAEGGEYRVVIVGAPEVFPGRPVTQCIAHIGGE